MSRYKKQLAHCSRFRFNRHLREPPGKEVMQPENVLWA